MLLEHLLQGKNIKLSMQILLGSFKIGRGKLLQNIKDLLVMEQ